MTTPEFEAIIQYRRQLREKQSASGPLDMIWGLTRSGIERKRERVWHLTPGKEAPARSVCGKELLKVVPRFHRPPGEAVCGWCRDQVPQLFQS